MNKGEIYRERKSDEQRERGRWVLTGATIGTSEPVGGGFYMNFH